MICLYGLKANLNIINTRIFID